jgi:hypothetical protein
MFTLTLSAEQLNVILSHLDSGAHGKVRPLIDDVLRQVNAQQNREKADAAAQADTVTEQDSVGLTD